VANPTATLALDDYHALIKVYKDVDKDIPKLIALKTKYDSWYAQVTRGVLSNYDRRALDIDFCYIENNLFSLELEQKKINLENWEAKLQAYTSRATNLNNSNFFPYYKIVTEFLGPEIEKQFNLNTEKGLSTVKVLLSKYEENLNLLILNTGICEETDYLAFQADYDTAVTEITDSQGHTHKCFISSAFVLPLDYMKFKEELEAYKTALAKYNTMYDIQKLLQDDHKELKVVKEEIAKTDKRHIEILSIFAALVMFVSNEIQIFSKIPDMRDAVAYTLFFAYGLGLFVLMIWFITRPAGFKPKSISSMHYFIIIIFSVGLISGIYYVNQSDPPKTDSQKKIERMDNRIEVLKKQRMIDTLEKKPVTDPKRARPKPGKDSPIGSVQLPQKHS
jgi:hypothetical protein